MLCLTFSSLLSIALEFKRNLQKYDGLNLDKPCLKRFFIGFFARNYESRMGYTAKGINNLWFAVRDIHTGDLISAKANKIFMQMRR